MTRERTIEAAVVGAGMKAQGYGQIWNMEGFGSGGQAQPGMLAYGATKRAVNYIGEFEQALMQAARRQGTQGVICGHIHHATMHHSFGVHYLNCGDWVESCTAVVVHDDGRFEIIDWANAQAPASEPAPLAAPSAR